MSATQNSPRDITDDTLLVFSTHKVEIHIHQYPPTQPWGHGKISGQQAIAKPFLGLCQHLGKTILFCSKTQTEWENTILIRKIHSNVPYLPLIGYFLVANLGVRHVYVVLLIVDTNI